MGGIPANSSWLCVCVLCFFFFSFFSSKNRIKWPDCWSSFMVAPLLLGAYSVESQSWYIQRILVGTTKNQQPFFVSACWVVPKHWGNLRFFCFKGVKKPTESNSTKAKVEDLRIAVDCAAFFGVPSLYRTPRAIAIQIYIPFLATSGGRT